MTFEDTDGQVLLDFDRPLRCQDCCCTGCYPNWTQLMEVKHKEQMVGKIREVPNGCCGNVELQVQDRQDLKLLGISGPCCPCGCCGADVPFQVRAAKKFEFSCLFFYYCFRLKMMPVLLWDKLPENGEVVVKKLSLILIPLKWNFHPEVTLPKKLY